jgi:hypothetical protein
MRIESGKVWPNKTDPEWRLLEGEGERTYDKYIDFKESFSKTPQIVIGISYLDIVEGSSHRIQVYAKDITIHGFSVEIKTWADTHIWGAGAGWLAYGE